MFRLPVCLLAVLAVSSLTQASVFESFEDGDYTSNPSWSLEINQGAAEFVDDPVRPNNLVYKVHGTNTGNRSIYTYLADDVPWTRFDISIDFMATDWGFHPQWAIASENLDYVISAGLWLDPSWDTIKLYPSEYQNRRLEYAVEIDPSSFAFNTWHQLHTTYNAQTGYVTTQLRVLDTDALVAELSYMPEADISQLGRMDTLWLGAEETQWQLFDNVALSPEPSTALVMGAGCIVLLHRRRR